jgi:hypothetical protein
MLGQINAPSNHGKSAYPSSLDFRQLEHWLPSTGIKIADERAIYKSNGEYVVEQVLKRQKAEITRMAAWVQAWSRFYRA